MKTVRLTMAQAQNVVYYGKETPMFAAVFAIFGHGKQGMALAAIAFAKQTARRRMMACTTSVGPGATNMITAAALEHVNRLPVLFFPGDTFASRRPDPVLQQLERGGNPAASVNDCFRPVSRYFDRIVRAEQIISSLATEHANVDFTAHARALGTESEHVASLAELEAALQRVRNATQSNVITLETDPSAAEAGGAWRDVPVLEVSARPQVRGAYAAYVKPKKKQPF